MLQAVVDEGHGLESGYIKYLETIKTLDLGGYFLLRIQLPISNYSNIEEEYN
jgi:hypothetical protein